MEETATNPMASERKPSIHKPLAVVSNQAKREEARSPDKAARRGAHTGGSIKVPSMVSHDRVRGFSHESFFSEHDTLRCKACDTAVSSKRYTIVNLCNGTSHKANLLKPARSSNNQQMNT